MLRRVDDVVQREVAGEVFLVPIRGSLADMQELYALNEVGSWLWARLDGSRPLADLVAGVMEEFDVDQRRAQEDTVAFLDDLLRTGLVREADVATLEAL